MDRESPRLRWHQVEADHALARHIALVGANLNTGATIVILGRIRVRRRVGCHIGVTVTGAAILLRHGETVGARHIGLAVFYGAGRSEEFRRRLGTRGVLEDLDGARRLALVLGLARRAEPLAILVDIEGVGPVLSDLTRVLRRSSDEMLARHDGLIIGEFRIIGRAELVGALDVVNHILVHFELLESALS